MDDLNWIERFLPLLRCPDTYQSLRWAGPEDLRKHGHPLGEKALTSADGSRIFLIDHGIPILLPQPK
jgi:uncharacterized protein YbaR (Trm112 family)